MTSFTGSAPNVNAIQIISSCYVYRNSYVSSGAASFIFPVVLQLWDLVRPNVRLRLERDTIWLCRLDCVIFSVGSVFIRR